MIVKGNIEIPSDLQGILYEKYDEKGAWKIKLLKEMQSVGIYVDLQNAVNQF
jgi:predicted nucleotide-binding protein